MKRYFSILVLVVCFLLAAIFLIASIMILPHAVVHDSEGWSAMVFLIVVCPCLAGATTLFGVIPSILLFWKGGRRTIDGISLSISWTTLTLIILGFFLVEPLRKAIIFKQSDEFWSLSIFLIPIAVGIQFALVSSLLTVAIQRLRKNSEVGWTQIAYTSLISGVFGSLCALFVLWAINAHVVNLLWQKFLLGK